jgi:hypothetical protein
MSRIRIGWTPAKAILSRPAGRRNGSPTCRPVATLRSGCSATPGSPRADRERNGTRPATVRGLQGELPNEILTLSLECYEGAVAGERRAFEFTSDGLSYEVTALPIHGQDGEVESAMAVVRDVTAQRTVESDRARLAAIVADTAIGQAERVARESQERVQALLDHAPARSRRVRLELAQHIDRERSLTRFAVIDTGPGIAAQQ